MFAETSTTGKKKEGERNSLKFRSLNNFKGFFLFLDLKVGALNPTVMSIKVRTVQNVQRI